MAKSNLLKPGHKAILEYYKALAEYRERGARHEGAVETAFSRLLADTARPHGWVLIPKEKLKVGKHTIFPDGTLHDLLFNELRRGYWEAKDTDDDLDAEISKKLVKDYPRNNTIFEDTRTAVLFQGGVERYRLDLTTPGSSARSSTSSTPEPTRKSADSTRRSKSSRAGCRSWRRAWSRF